MNIPIDISTIKLVTDKGVLSISKIENFQAYDQHGDPIPSRFFKAFPHILSV